MQTVVSALVLWSVLIPGRQWVPPSAPLNVTVQAPQKGGQVTLMLADFTGSTIGPTGPAEMKDGQTVDLKGLFPPISRPGSYLLFAVQPVKGQMPLPIDFIGTPLVIEVRQDPRVGAPSGPMVTRIRPLQYVEAQTSAGPMTIAFYYDAAPVTIDNFLRLAGQGFYDGLAFHTILPGFSIQTGDPKDDGTGGPGYTVEAEFNNRKHEAGVIAMSRMRDPLEDAAAGIAPRPEFAHSAGSQFFICLDYKHTQQYDHAYTAFAKVVTGMETVKAIAATPLADARAGRPEKAPVVQKLTVKTVDPQHNPYKGIVNFGSRKGAEK
jgi:cyclophilin family peptidyl-prolyl cis-trans isomerase